MSKKLHRLFQRWSLGYQNITESPRIRRWWPNSIEKTKGFRALCLNLHIGLVLLHVILLGISIPHWEHRKVISLGAESTAWSIGLPAFSQAFVTLYSAGMLVLTQQLSLRRNLLQMQTLTATHDKSIAWNGLGSSLLSLWRQVSLPASVGGVASIMVYLSGISILHISTPALLTLEAFNNTIQTDLRSTRGLPNPVVNASGFITQDTLNFFADAVPVLLLMGKSSKLSTTGLHGSTVYDVLPDNQGTGNVPVNSTTFDVYCDALQQPHATFDQGIWNITTDPTDPLRNDSSFQVPIVSPNVFRIAALDPDKEAIGGGGNRVLFYSSINFTDSQGVTGSRVTLNPPMDADETGTNLIYTLQVMSCRFFSSNSTIYVNARTKSPPGPPQQKTSSSWGSPQPGTHFLDNSTELATIKNWQAAFSQAAGILGTVVASPCADATQCDLLSVPDQFMAQQLDITPDTNREDFPQPHPQLELHRLENALANLTAALHWSIIQLNAGNSTMSKVNSLAFEGQATVSEPQLASRLKLNMLPISVGLAASVILLILAVLLIGLRFEKNTNSVDNTGVLHIIWLSHKRPDVLSRVSEVKSPSTDDLRASGMFLVRMAGDYRGLDDYK